MYRMIGILKSGRNVVLTESASKDELVKELRELSIQMMDPTVTKYVFSDDTHATAVKDISSAYIEEGDE